MPCRFCDQGQDIAQHLCFVPTFIKCWSGWMVSFTLPFMKNLTIFISIKQIYQKDCTPTNKAEGLYDGVYPKPPQRWQDPDPPPPPPLLELCPNLVLYESCQKYVSKGITRPFFYDDLICKLRRVRGKATLISSGSKMIKRLRWRQCCFIMIERSIGIVLGPTTIF